MRDLAVPVNLCSMITGTESVCGGMEAQISREVMARPGAAAEIRWSVDQPWPTHDDPIEVAPNELASALRLCLQYPTRRGRNNHVLMGRCFKEGARRHSISTLVLVL